MKILSWNILHGGGKRSGEILAYIRQQQPDIVTLQEFRHNASSAALLEGLAAMGLDEQFAPPTPSARDNTLIIAANSPFQAQIFPKTAPPPARAIRAFFPDLGELNLLAAHLPQKKKQPPYLHALLDLDPALRRENSLIIGDLNIGIPFEDSQTRSFEHHHLFRQLLNQGWVDAWRSRNPGKQTFSWLSTQHRNGFRYDHALASPPLDPRIETIDYDHQVREHGLSDHSSLILTFTHSY